MKIITRLYDEDVLRLVRDDKLTKHHVLVTFGPNGEIRTPATANLFDPEAFAFWSGNMRVLVGHVQALVALGGAHIEVQEPDVFDDPAFAGWVIAGNCRELRTSERAAFLLYSEENGTASLHWWLEGVGRLDSKTLRMNPTLAANLVDVARIINALAEIAPAQVVADAVVAFVKYKESQS